MSQIEDLLEKTEKETKQLQTEEAGVVAPFEEKRAALKRKLQELDAEEQEAVANVKRRRENRESLDRWARVVRTLIETEDLTVAVPEDDLQGMTTFLCELLEVDNDHSRVDLEKLANEEFGEAADRAEVDQRAFELLKSIWPRLRFEYQTGLTLHYKTDAYGIVQDGPEDEDFTFHHKEWDDEEDTKIECDDLCPDDDMSMETLIERYGDMDAEYEDGDKEGIYYYKRKSLVVYVLKLASVEDDDEDE